MMMMKMMLSYTYNYKKTCHFLFTKQVDFTFRLAFRRSYSGDYHCDSSTVSSQGIIGSGGSWQAEAQGYSYNIANTGFHCTDYSVYEDWSSGENAFNYNFSSTGPWVVRLVHIISVHRSMNDWDK